MALPSSSVVMVTGIPWGFQEAPGEGGVVGPGEDGPAQECVHQDSPPHSQLPPPWCWVLPSLITRMAAGPAKWANSVVPLGPSLSRQQEPALTQGPGVPSPTSRHSQPPSWGSIQQLPQFTDSFPHSSKQRGRRGKRKLLHLDTSSLWWPCPRPRAFASKGSALGFLLLKYSVIMIAVLKSFPLFDCRSPLSPALGQQIR